MFDALRHGADWRHLSRDVFRWEATLRSTGTPVAEDVNGLGGWAKLNPLDVATVALARNEWARLPLPGGGYVQGEGRVTCAIPEGARAVFARRRMVVLDGMGAALGWTIIGWDWPEADDKREPVYHFFSDDGVTAFQSNDYNAV